jgi:hypothetical protein
MLISVLNRANEKGLEIHSESRKEIAVKLVNNYSQKVALRGGLPVIRFSAKDAEGERILRLLIALQQLKQPIRRDEQFRNLLGDLSLDTLENFVSVKKLLEKQG